MEQNESKLTQGNYTLYPEDVLYCQTLFNLYTDHLKFATSLSNYALSLTKEHLKKYETAGPYAAEFEEINDALIRLRKVEYMITKSLAKQIETYFREKYNIDFASQELKIDNINVTIGSFSTLVDNIVCQVGKDFLIAGKEQIIKRFSNEFLKDNRRPVIRANVIHFPLFASYVENKYPEFYINLKSDCVTISRHLLDAIDLFFYFSLQQPPTFKELILNWRGKIDTEIWYVLYKEHNLSIKFFKNRRVSLKFKDAKSATNFFQYFDLWK
jgi:hypothetical protein